MRRQLLLACALILAMWTSAGTAHAGDPTPTATPSSTPGRDPDASYAAPEERRAGPGPARTAAKGGAVAGAAGSVFALYYLRPW